MYFGVRILTIASILISMGCAHLVINQSENIALKVTKAIVRIPLAASTLGLSEVLIHEEVQYQQIKEEVKAKVLETLKEFQEAVRKANEKCELSWHQEELTGRHIEALEKAKRLGALKPDNKTLIFRGEELKCSFALQEVDVLRYILSLYISLYSGELAVAAGACSDTRCIEALVAPPAPPEVFVPTGCTYIGKSPVGGIDYHCPE